MTGKWLGQQPLRQASSVRQSHQATPASLRSAVAVCCLLLACGGCIDFAARTAGLPITGEPPPSDDAAVADDSGDIQTATAIAPAASENPAEAILTAQNPTAQNAAAGNSAAEDLSTAVAADGAKVDQTAAGSVALPAPGSAVDFPDAADVGLATKSVAD